MIARIWHGRVPLSKSDAYLEHMRAVAIPRYRAVPGNISAYALLRAEGSVAHIEMLTFWESLEAIKGFAGENVEEARYYDFDKDFLLEFEPTCRHCQAYDK
jgi:hypothetical protein